MVTLRLKEARNLKEKMQGLIGKNKPFTLMIRTRFGIHTFGLKFSIDVLILDNKNKVVSIRENLRPNKIFLWNPMYEKVLELPQGTIDRKGIRIKDKINVLLSP